MFYFRFKWDLAHGYQSFVFKGVEPDAELGGRLWRYLVATQTKPALAFYLRLESSGLADPVT